MSQATWQKVALLAVAPPGQQPTTPALAKQVAAPVVISQPGSQSGSLRLVPMVGQPSKQSAAAQQQDAPAIKQAAALWQPGEVVVVPIVAPTVAASTKPAAVPGMRSMGMHKLVQTRNGPVLLRPIVPPSAASASRWVVSRKVETCIFLYPGAGNALFEI
jgi:hypothetical protein